ncbi:MAG: histidinol-phosphate transaminase [Eubacterium sp.]|nr:histidinol-phosphate transaminase [Eubacterium sp.]
MQDTPGGWKRFVRKVEPYVPGEQPSDRNMIKLNTNENPYPPSPDVVRALRMMSSDENRLYPDPNSTVLVNAVAERYGVKPSQVFVGVGSDDVLANAFLTFFNSENPILFPDVTYSFYKVWAACYGIPYETVPLTEDWRIDPALYARKNGGIVFPNPNAPTGVAMDRSAVREILLKNRDVVVIVDEAYVDFGAESALPLLEEFDNLLVVQTFSKSRSMAGMRIGFAIGNEELIRCLSDVRFSINSYTMNRPSLAAGTAAIRDEDYFRKTLDKIMETRDSVKDLLEAMGFFCLESCANFLFVSHPDVPAKELFEALRERHIYVRYFSQPRIDNFLRITIGTTEQMQVLLDSLTRILRERAV